MISIITPREALFGIGYAGFLVIHKLRIMMWQSVITKPLLFPLYSNISYESMHDLAPWSVLYYLEVNTLFRVISIV